MVVGSQQILSQLTKTAPLETPHSLKVLTVQGNDNASALVFGDLACQQENLLFLNYAREKNPPFGLLH